jgi:hypothetical protein
MIQRFLGQGQARNTSQRKISAELKHQLDRQLGNMVGIHLERIKTTLIVLRKLGHGVCYIPQDMTDWFGSKPRA